MNVISLVGLLLSLSNLAVCKNGLGSLLQASQLRPFLKIGEDGFPALLKSSQHLPTSIEKNDLDHSNLLKPNKTSMEQFHAVLGQFAEQLSNMKPSSLESALPALSKLQKLRSRGPPRKQKTEQKNNFSRRIGDSDVKADPMSQWSSAAGSFGGVTMAEPASYHRRTRRQTNPLFHAILGPGDIRIPIPTTLPHLNGQNERGDGCPRSELFYDGQCYQALSQGPCDITQQLIAHPRNNSAYCAPRLCSPDRVFIFSDQLCHDPSEPSICPPGRELFVSLYGTPVCACPDGTYEDDTDLDDDVCSAIVTTTSKCKHGQVFWFRDFSMEPECLPDPCGGLNLNRGINDLPFVPAADGVCHQVGSKNVCPEEMWYALKIDELRGECESLEDAGYSILDPDVLEAFTDIYGPPVSKQSDSSTSVISADFENEVENQNNDDRRLRFGQASSGANLPSNSAFRTRQRRSLQPHHRRVKRVSQPYATPGNVIEPRLVGCRAGAIRDYNLKCRNTVLPSRVPSSRPRRFSRPVKPNPSCPSGSFFGIGRMCTSRNSATSSVNTYNLG